MRLRSPWGIRFVGGFTAVLFGALLWGQRADRATITGVVVDPNTASIVGATVRIRNEGTGVETNLKSNEAGAYTSPLLTLGTYTVSVENPGFKTFVRSGIQLVGGTVYRQDAAMELGAVTERVVVTAASELINTSQPEVSSTVDQNYYKNLPVIMGSDIRLAESLLLLQPGYLPMKPNGDPMFRGSQFNSRMNGGQTFGMENYFDGAAFGASARHQQSHESGPSIESIQEMKVTNSIYSAQYGHTTGGSVEYTSKSGTNQLHGNLYEYFANDRLNARGFFPAKRSTQRSNNYGFSVGAPVYIPKVYNGKNKTFFFFNLDYTKLRQGVLPGFGNSTPIDEFKQGNFSQMLGTQVATDALNRPIFSGQIFDPNTERLVNNVTVRDAFPGNIIPAAHPLRSQVAAKIIPLMVRPDREGVSFNVAGNAAGDQTWVGNYRTPLIRIDHVFNDKFRMATSFFWPYRPAIRNCGEVQGCSVPDLTEAGTANNDQYIGVGFHQRIVTHHVTQQFDTVIKPNLLHHATVSFDRWYMGGQPLSGGVGWPTKLWGSLERSGLLDNTAGSPVFSFTGNTPITTVGNGWISNGFEAANRWQFANDLTWVKGKHQIKIGAEFRHHQFNYKGWGVATGGNFNFNRLGTSGFDANGNSIASTGDPFASFILGQVHQASFTIPFFHTFTGNYTSAYINDEYKVTSRLTLTLGFRFDYQFPWNERHNSMSTFAADVPNPGAGGRLGAMIFAGTGTGRSGRRDWYDTPKDAFGPRLGFAYRVGNKSVVRGGYGVYYNSKSFDASPRPIQGFQGIADAPNTTNGLDPAFYLDSGFPRDRVSFGPFVNPAFANGVTVTAIPADEFKLPRYQNWSLTVQRQLSDNMMADVSYVANRGTRLSSHSNFLGPAANMNDPSVLGLGAALLQSNINSPAARAANIPIPYAGFNGNVAQALRPYPQYQALNYRVLSVGQSSFHSLQAKFDKRFSEGLQLRVFYTWSKLINVGAENAERGNVPVQNPIATLRENRSYSEDDVPHSFVTAWTWELPIAKGATGLTAKLLHGWTLNGILRYETPRPLTITMTNDMGGVLFNTTKRPNRVAGVAGKREFENFDPNVDRVFNPAAWADPGPLTFGNSVRADGSVRGIVTAISEDVSIFKLTRFGERITHRLEAQFGNVGNRTVFCEPNTNWTGGAAFGQTATQCNQPRSIQLGMKVEF